MCQSSHLESSSSVWSSTETKDIMDNFSGKVTSEKVLLLKSSTHQNVVVSIPSRRDENLSSWCVLPFRFDEVRYMFGYWEWVEDVLARCKETLDNIKTYDVIIASMFMYDHNEKCFPRLLRELSSIH
ncbi:hypothetical protein H5410_040480 [Solanum commersonii]|uniref:Uncharacterized protein n=1 Tax=Solanum commersonii TaxID=4109 RepID=A0A9J5XSM4_SOLCO|nr:hypothetical protein H5410_040480 [Solanum commersonii]